MPPWLPAGVVAELEPVSVPRRALRGHAPLLNLSLVWLMRCCFSAPKGVERACPPLEVWAGSVKFE